MESYNKDLTEQALSLTDIYRSHEPGLSFVQWFTFLWIFLTGFDLSYSLALIFFDLS